MPVPGQQDAQIQSLPGADAVDNMAAGSTPDNGGSGNPQPQADNNANQAQSAPAPQQQQAAADEDPDGDRGFSSQFPEKTLPQGLAERIKKLQEQRDNERKRLKDYEYFKPYADEKGRGYLKSLVDFDSHLEKSLQERAYLRPLLQELLAQGRDPNWKNLQALIKQHAPADQAGAREMEEAAAQAGEEDPLAREVAELKKNYGSLREEQAKKEEAQRFETEKQGHKLELQKQIDEFKKSHPDLAGNNKLIRAGIQNAMASGASVKDSLENLVGLFGDLHKGKLQAVAKQDQASAGAETLKAGKTGSTLKEMPKLGSDAQRDAMYEMYGIKD